MWRLSNFVLVEGVKRTTKYDLRLKIPQKVKRVLALCLNVCTGRGVAVHFMFIDSLCAVGAHLFRLYDGQVFSARMDMIHIYICV